MRGDLWAPGGRALAFASPPEGICGCQTTRNLDSCRHARGFVGAKRRETRIRGPSAAMLWAPRRPAAAFSRPTAGAVWVTNDASRPGVAPSGPAACVPIRGPGPALIESLVNGHPMLHISPQSSCLARIAPTTAQAPSGNGVRRPALDSAGWAARAVQLLWLGIVFVCPSIMPDRPGKVKPRFVRGTNRHCPPRPDAVLDPAGGREERAHLPTGFARSPSAPPCPAAPGDTATARPALGSGPGTPLPSPKTASGASARLIESPNSRPHAAPSSAAKSNDVLSVIAARRDDKTLHVHDKTLHVLAVEFIRGTDTEKSHPRDRILVPRPRGWRVHGGPFRTSLQRCGRWFCRPNSHLHHQGPLSRTQAPCP